MISDVAPVNSFPRNTTSDASSQWVFDTQGADWSVSQVLRTKVPILNSKLLIGVA